MESGLPGAFGDKGLFLTKGKISVIFGEVAERVIKEADETEPDVILCNGQAGGRTVITPELVGINLRQAVIPDNTGNHRKDESIESDRYTAYFSTLPARRMAEAIDAAVVPSQVSYSASAYGCNDVLYTLLSHFQNSRARVGVIHVPYFDGQNKSTRNKNE